MIFKTNGVPKDLESTYFRLTAPPPEPEHDEDRAHNNSKDMDAESDKRPFYKSPFFWIVMPFVVGTIIGILQIVVPLFSR